MSSHDEVLLAEWTEQYSAPRQKPKAGEPVVDLFVSKFQRRELVIDLSLCA
jgi:hypothetical protein